MSQSDEDQGCRENGLPQLPRLFQGTVRACHGQVPIHQSSAASTKAKAWAATVSQVARKYPFLNRQGHAGPGALEAILI